MMIHLGWVAVAMILAFALGGVIGFAIAVSFTERHSK